MSEENAKLLTIDGATIEVARHLAEQSVLIKGVIEDQGLEDDIPLPSTKKATLEKIIAYWTHLYDNAPPEVPKPLRTNKLEDCVEPFYAEFINKLSQEELFDLLITANVLDVQSLLELCSAKVAADLKDQPIDKVRAYFHEQNDITPEMSKQIEEENRWAEESF